MLFDERLAYGARAVMIASTVVRGAMFRRMIAIQKKSVYVCIYIYKILIFCLKKKVGILGGEKNSYYPHRSLHWAGFQRLQYYCCVHPLLRENRSKR